MSYHYGSYRPQANYQTSLPQESPLYRGPQDHSRGFYSGMNSGTQMVHYSNVQHAPVYHHPALQSMLYDSSQSYSQLPQQHASHHVDDRQRFDVTNQPQRNAYLPSRPPLPDRGPQPQLQLAQNATYASTGPYEPAPNFGLGNSDPTFHPGLGFGSNNVSQLPIFSNSRRVQSLPDINVLDGLPSLKRRQGHYAHMESLPRWEPKKAQTVKPRLLPQFSLSAKPKGFIKGSNRDWSVLQPGAICTLIPVTSFVPSCPLDKYFQDAATHRDTVIYLPRCSDFSGKDKDPHACIEFSVDGMPGPYLLDLAEARVTIDGEDDKIFEQFVCRSTKLQIDWPGLSIPPEELKVFYEDGLPLRRGELAALLGTCIAKLIINTQRGYALPMGETQNLSGCAISWDIMKVDYTHLRLISVNYYDKVWVPVLALDIAAYNI